MALLLILGYGFAFAAAHWAGSGGRGNALTLLPVAAFGAMVSLSRLALNTGDLPVYVEGFADDDWNLYYLREAPFWALGRLLDSIAGEPRITFFCIDVTLVFALTRFFGGTMNWAFVVLLLAFPTVLGFTNIYRQLVASVLMMGALAALGRGDRRGPWMAALACTVHVAMIGLCMALLSVHLLGRGRRAWLLALLPAVVLVGLPLLEGLTLVDISGGTESRGNTAPLYIALGTVLHLMAWRHLRSLPAWRPLHLGLLAFFVAGAASLLYAPASTGTRVMMISMHLSAFLLLMHLATARQRLLPTLALALLLAGPVIVSDSAWHLIFGYAID